MSRPSPFRVIPSQGPSTPAGQTARDPVCGMTVNPETAPARLEHDGRTYYFCCSGCMEKFRAAPAKYLSGAPGQTAAHREAHTTGSTAEYICPMDPEVRQEKPGSCPKCGMG